MLPLPFGCGLLAANTDPESRGSAFRADDGVSGRPDATGPGPASLPGGQASRAGPAGGPRLPSHRRRWTPVGLAVFGASLAVVIGGGLATDRALGAPPLPSGAAWSAGGWSLAVLGLALCGWCVSLFANSGGTPVPLNPPRDLVQRGPYAWARNPMLTGVFAALFGTGILLRSPSTVFLWIPAYVLVHVLEIKRVEEPDLERRFGVAYRAYRDATPMFIPRPWRRP
jgi:protein-S-isoprenylcysteine O-methyltransferase Ste14